MKKMLCIILSAILICSVILPLSVFAENGPYPVDWETITEEDLYKEDFKLSTIMMVNMPNAEDYETFEEYMAAITMGFVYPQIEGLELPSAFAGASYNEATNTLTLKNVRLPYTVLATTAMGDDFKINLVGYNELAGISSDGMGWGGSITLTGSGELVLNKAKTDLISSAVEIYGSDTAAFFKAEKNVNLKINADPENETPAISVIGSTLTDASQLIQLEGSVKKGGAVITEAYTVDVYEQIEVYDFYWNMYDYSDKVFTKADSDILYAGFEDYDEETYEPNGKYYIYSLEFDDILGCYVGTALGENSINPSTEGYTVKMDGAIPATIENIFVAEEKSKLNVALSEDGSTKYGFDYYESYYEDGDAVTEYTIYTIIEHPTYGYVAKEVPNKYDLEGLVAQKIGEKHYIDAVTADTLVMNYGGSVLPKSVGGIKVTAHTSGVKITWTPISRTTKYRVYRKAPGDKSWTTLTTLSGEKTSSYIDKTAKSGVKYTYTVKACNIVGWGAYNKTGVSLTYLKAPAFKLANTISGVNITWGKIPGAKVYRVYRKAPGETKYTTLKETTGLTFTDKTAKNGVNYTYTVKAITGNVASAYKGVNTIFVATPKLTAIKNTTSGVTVAWSKVNGATAYRVYRKASGETSWTKLGDTKNLNFTDKTAKSGKTYTYTVKAFNGSFAGGYNKTGLSIKFLAAPALKVANATNGVKVSWSKAAGAKTYRVYRKAAGETNWTKLGDTTRISFTDKTAKSGKTYAYCVKALNGNVASAGNSAKIDYLKAPAIKSIKNVVYGQTITWEKVAGADGYNLYAKTEEDTKWTLIKNIDDPSKTSYKYNNLRYGLNYTYTVRAYNETSTSSYIKSGTTYRYIAPPPYNIETTKNGVSLIWGRMANIDEYKIYRKADGESKWTLIGTTSNPTDDNVNVATYADKNVSKGKTYSYRVTARWDNTVSGYETQTITFK